MLSKMLCTDFVTNVSFLLFQVEDVVVATSDYTAAADDEVSLKAGDIVEVLDSKTALGSK